MKKILLLCCLSTFFFTSYVLADNAPIVADYFGIWANDDAVWHQKFRADTPLDQLNRLYICFGGIKQQADGHFTIEFDGDISRVLELIQAMKEKNPTGEIFLTVGGNNGSTSFGGAASDPAFADNVVAFLHQYKLDGIDVDWESGLVKSSLSNLLQALGTTLHANNLKVTLDVWPFVQSAYDMAVINTYVDQINIMSYGTGLSVQSSAESFENAGLMANKIIGGIETEADYYQFGGDVDSLGDTGTIAAKANYALTHQLAGMMAWRMDNDYVHHDKPGYPTYAGAQALWKYMHASLV